ncbi:MAG: phage portal protein [Clostridiales bacterium]|nr:phage portal protein [Clostridiales bacterium]
MICYLDREEVPDVEDISPAVLRYLVERAEEAAGRYQRLDDYYRGLHPILRQRKTADEVQVAVNYAKYVVDLGLGYYLGEPVKYDGNPRRRKEKDPFGGVEVSLGRRRAADKALDLSPLLDCFDRQHISEVDQEIGKGMGIFGECLELCYASSEEQPRPRSAKIDPRSGILVCDSTVEHNKLFALVWERRETTAREKYYFLTVYTDHTEKDYRSDDLKTAVFHQVGETREHYFGEVPVIGYENNGERQGDFEQIISLIDAYDQLMSSRLTDKKKFLESLLVFFGMTLREGDEGRLAREKFLDGAPLDARVEYIQKTFDEQSVQVLADALVREMHKMTLTVDMSDEKFAGNASGQALKLKLLTMNLMVKNKIRRMERGLKERFRLYNRWLYTMGEMDLVGTNDVDVVFTVNMPIDEGEIVEMVTRLQGIVDDQTLLSQLWFIRDPAEALENIRRQRGEEVSKQRAEKT